MKRIISAVLLLVLCCFLLTGCFCKHEWKDATCTTPTTCSLCGKTEGTAPGHMAGELVSGLFDFGDKVTTSYQNCKVCGETLHSETTNLTSVISGGKFIYTPNQFNDAMDEFSGSDYSFEVSTLDSGALISIIYDASGNLVGALMYRCNGESITMDDADSDIVDSLLIYWYTDDNSLIVDCMTGLLIGTDLSLDSQGALNLLSAIIDSYTSGGYSQNGLAYEVTLNDGDFVFLISVK